MHDAGTVMHASGAEAQQVGGQCTGVGESLLEEIVYDRATGTPLNFNFVDYGFPTMMDFPKSTRCCSRCGEGAGEYGACGIGEGAPTSTPRAIVNAIYNAVGVRIDDIPVTPRKVLEALAMQAAATATSEEAGGGETGGLQPYADRLTAVLRAEIDAASCTASACGMTEVVGEMPAPTPPDVPSSDGGAA